MHGPRRALLLALGAAVLASGCIGMLQPDETGGDEPAGGDVTTASTFEEGDAAGAGTSASSNATSGRSSARSTNETARPVTLGAARVREGVLEVEVPVPVVLVGFGQATAARLVKELDAEAVRHAILSSGQSFPPIMGPDFRVHAFPLQPVPRYDVRVLPEPAAESFFARLASEGTLAGGVYDGDVAERLLAETQAREGLAPRAEAPTLVLLHAGARLASPHSYRVSYEAGALEGARSFGEREPLLAVDLSAAPDPWVGEERPYEKTMKDRGGAEVSKTLAILVRGATEHRLLQAPLYPVAAEGCHGITVLGVTRAGSLGPAPLLPRAFDAIDPDALRASFAHLAGGETVHVDLKLLRLPVDDPALHAVASTGNLDAIRWYVTERWDDYWVPHQGCEAYLSVLVEGTLADGSMGIAHWDVDEDRRISFTVVGDQARLCEMELGCTDHSPDAFALPMYLVAHETGHLFGQRHPHDVTLHDGKGHLAPAFSSVRSVMSYQVADLTWSFGAVDANNWARNRVATLWQQAGADALDEDALEPVLDALARQDWRQAANLLAAAQPVPARDA